VLCVRYRSLRRTDPSPRGVLRGVNVFGCYRETSYRRLRPTRAVEPRERERERERENAFSDELGSSGIKI